MTEIDMLLAGMVGGSIAGLAMAWVVLGHIKYCYDRKLMILRMQIIGLQAINGISEGE